MNSIELLRELSTAFGPSGFEDDVRELVKKHLGDICNFSFDKMGSVICSYQKAPKAIVPKVLIAGHMDEIGFLVQNITSDGFIKMQNLGGWWEHTLLSQKMIIRGRKGDITGVIGAKPKHHLSEAERNKVLPLKEIFIDIGAKNKKEVTDVFGINLGDPIIPKTEFEQMKHKNLIMSKAFDDRVGVSLMVEAMRHLAHAKLPCELIGAGTVQEEVGIRGAETTARLVVPDLAIILEGPPGDDTPGFSKEDIQCGLGLGPQVRFYDPTAIMNRKLCQLVSATAVQKKIKHQIAIRTSGGTDAKAIHLSKIGVPTIVFGVPVRYAHGHVGIVDMSDYEACLELVISVIKKLDAKTVKSFTAY
ncbi:MAG: hypothetical protein A2X86_01730 [Bdellovibrionales bacterium GWA2_49_15]|nr:MAG: hypothetical protein A2X86_01730 [Bdellovibrionales bacterium GWA2_49_15]